MTIEDLMQYGYVELRYIIEWARKVPGMCDEEVLFTIVEPSLRDHSSVTISSARHVYLRFTAKNIFKKMAF